MSEGPIVNDSETSVASGFPALPALLPLPSRTHYSFAVDRSTYFGWHGGCFQITRDTMMRTRTLHQFPLTDEGWSSAWQTMLAWHPALAEQVAARVHELRTSPETRRRRLQADEDGKRQLDRLSVLGLVPECTLVGGYGWDDTALVPGTSCTLRFTEEGLWVHRPSDSIAMIRSPYRDAIALEFTGPGRVTRSGGFFGGGFGLTAAAEGMIAASVLNALTKRTTIHTIIRYQTTDLEAFFFHWKATPADLRVQLSKVLSMIMPTDARSDAGNIVSQLARLAELHREGALSDDEFVALKAKIIASL